MSPFIEPSFGIRTCLRLCISRIVPWANKRLNYQSYLKYNQLIIFLWDLQMSEPKNDSSMLAINKKQETKEPKLTYYYIRGLAQPIRNLLYYLEVKFIDNRLDKDSVQLLQFDKYQCTFNSGLPVWEEEEVRVSDPIAISIHICKKYQGGSLLGTSIKKRAKVNQVMFKFWMQNKKIIPGLVDIIKNTSGFHQDDKKKAVCAMLRKLVGETRFLSFCLNKYNKNGSWIIGELSLVDFYFYEICFYIHGFFRAYIEDELLLGLSNFCQKFESLAFHSSQYIKNTKLFFPFKSEQLTEIVLSAWSGDEDQDII